MKTPIDDLNEEDLIREYEEENNKNPRTKKLVILLIAIFMIGLMSSYIYLGYPLFGILFGLIDSSTIQGNVIRANDISVVFENQPLTMALSAYEDNPDVETSLCMHGVRDGSVYRINYSYQPIIYSQSYTHVSHEPCDNKTVLLFHTHPYNRCSPSGTDIQTLRRAQEKNEDVGMLIMCSPNRFSIYT